MAPEIELRALALFERLSAKPDNDRLRERILRNEPSQVRDRIATLLASSKVANAVFPTELAGTDLISEIAVPGRLGRFRLIERIGVGGMGEVWRAERDDGLYQQQAAVKLIHPDLLIRAGAAFEDERRFLARLEHPNIARLIDGGIAENGLPWLITEYVGGEPIDQAVTGLALRKRVDLFIKAADAVQFAHSKFVAHGDIKPANLLVTPEGRVKLLDFGIGALIGDDAPRPAATGAMTRSFSSPERIAGEGPSIADDIFALGTTLALLIGADADPDLRAIARKAIDPAPGNRYGSVAGFIGDLDRWRERLTVSARPNNLPYRTRKFVSRHRLGVAAATLAMALMAAATIIASLSYFNAERQRAKADARFNEVRSLARYQLFELYDQLRRAPGTVAIRADIAQKSAGYLNHLRSLPNPPPDLIFETAAGYRRLAKVQGLSGTSSLGKPTEALRSLDIAEHLIRQLLRKMPENAQAFEQLGWIYSDRWTLASSGERDIAATNGMARQYFQKTLALQPRRTAALLGLIVTQKNSITDMIANDQAAAALPLARKVLTDLEHVPITSANRDDVLALRVSLSNRLGDALYYVGDLPKALKTYRDAARIIDQSIAQFGETPDWLARRGEAMWNISGTLSDMKGRFSEAEQAAAQGVAALQHVQDFGPDAQAEKMLLILYGQQAIIFSATSRPDQALATSTIGIKLREKRLKEAPTDLTRRRDLAIGLASHVEMLANNGRRKEACQYAISADELWQMLMAEHRIGRRDLRI